MPRSIVSETEGSLQAAGKRATRFSCCGAGSWTTTPFGSTLRHVPEQTSFQTEDGLLVRVEGPALHELNMWLFENHEMLGIQVHAHPTDAYHSETDDAFPIMTT